MIFITLGTQDMPFDRLLKSVEKWVIDNHIDEEIIAQVGCSRYRSPYFINFEFLNPEQYNQYVKESRLVIAHSGAGSLFHAMHQQKCIVTMPRLKVFNEHNDDHQLELATKLYNEGYLLMVHNDFDEINSQLTEFKPRLYVTHNNIVNQIKNWLE